MSETNFRKYPKPIATKIEEWSGTSRAFKLFNVQRFQIKSL